jgi:Zn-dependent peptidase ImmA (M78 family)
MPEVNPEILTWARETAGLTPEQAAAKLQLKPARGLTAVERLAALERGEVAPSRTLLRTMAERYRRPLLTFYMPAPPRRGSRGEDFRSLPGNVPRATEALLDALVRDIRARQALLKAAIEDEQAVTPLAFVGSVDSSVSVQSLVTSVRETLRVTPEEFRNTSGVDAAFQMLRERTEEAGVFVLLIGDLGSHHSALDTDTFRGFAIADPIAPLIVINDRDAKSAWSFTLLHELVHIWLGQSGVSGGEPDQAIERFCNDVASEFLLPQRELDSHPWANLRQLEIAVEQISEFAAPRRVSRQLVAYRLFRAGRLDPGSWTRVRQALHDAWLEERRRSREEARETEGGPSYYVVRRHRLGKNLIALVGHMLASGVVTTTKAARILGVRPKNVGPLIVESRASDEGGPVASR